MATKADLSLMEAAFALRKSYSQTLRLALIGDIDARREGRSWLVSRGSLDRLLEREGRAPVAEKTLTPAA